MSLYFESHITIAPVFDTALQKLKTICLLHGFHVANLLMQKRAEDQPDRSKYDTFCTGRDLDYEPLFQRTMTLVSALQEHGYTVWRYKIEDTLIDSKYDDSMFLLKGKTS